MGDEEVEVEGAEEGEAVAGEIFRLKILPIVFFFTSVYFVQRRGSSRG